MNRDQLQQVRDALDSKYIANSGAWVGQRNAALAILDAELSEGESKVVAAGACKTCGNEYLASRTDIYKDKRPFIYCDHCGAMADSKTWYLTHGVAQPQAAQPAQDIGVEQDERVFARIVAHEKKLAVDVPDHTKQANAALREAATRKYNIAKMVAQADKLAVDGEK